MILPIIFTKARISAAIIPLFHSANPDFNSLFYEQVNFILISLTLRNFFVKYKKFSMSE